MNHHSRNAQPCALPINIEQLRQDIVFTEQLCGKDYQFHTTWGLFSPKAIDTGTRLLLQHMQIQPTDRTLDLGCGYGPLGMVMAQHATHCCLVDKDFVAVEYARANLKRNQIPNANVVLSNGLQHIPPQTFTLVASNLPAKSNKEHYILFFHDICQHLEPGGRCYVVVVNGLRHFIKRTFKTLFGNYTKIKQSTTHTVALATKQQEL
ncbi:MAG: methyltransferase [Pseudomonadota bacterium]